MTKRRVAFLFPGQGAQFVGMGKDFYDHFSQAKEVFQQGDDLLKRPLTKTIFEGPAEHLTETRNSQTGIFLNSMAILAVIQHQFPDLKPNVCSGLSLGEYTALCSSGRLSFEKTLPLVQYRADAMQTACETTKGTMAALFGLSAEEVEALIKEVNLPNDLWVANFNCPGQTVISGTVKGVEAGIEAAKLKGAKRAIPLKVHGAFHSGLMKLAEEKLSHQINRLDFAQSPIKMVMNVPGNYVEESEAIRLYMIEQVTSPVRWEQGIRAMMPNVDLFIEIGCGRTLAGMNKYIGVTAPTISVGTIQDMDKLAESLSA